MNFIKISKANSSVKVRPLCLSFWTPPALRPQSILIGKMIPEWMVQGIEPVIMTYDICGRWDIGLQIIRIPEFRINRFNFPCRLIPKLRGVLEKRYFEYLFRKYESVILGKKINIVFSFSNPFTSNVLGAMLKEKLGIKFVSHFSDPFYDHPMGSRCQAFAQDDALTVETAVISKSDRVIFVNDVLKSQVMGKYPISEMSKAVVIPHCYDKKMFMGSENKKRKGKYILSHIGAFYRQRNPEVLFKALSIVKKKRPDLKERFVLDIVGATNKYAHYSNHLLDEMVEKYALYGILRITPPVTYEESLQVMKSSDCLLVIDVDLASSPFLPSKLIDYIGSKSNIISITNENSPSYKLCNRLKARTFNYQQHEKLASFLDDVIYGDQEGEGLDWSCAEEFSVTNTTRKLLDVFQEVVG